MSVVLLEQEIVHYEVLGRGRPLIFLHGWVGSWRYWIPVMQAASVSFRAYALDLWGFGDTAKAARRYSLDQQSALIDSFMNEMGIGRVALVGHGLGALVALYFAQNNPDIVDRVMAISCPMEDGGINARLRTAQMAELSDWLVARSAAAEPVRSDALKADQQAIVRSLDDLPALHLKTLWFQFNTNCLLVNGLNDPAVTPPNMEQMAELPDQIHNITFEQSGHFPMLDEDNKFNRLMVDFLALRSGETPRDLQLKEEWKRRVR